MSELVAKLHQRLQHIACPQSGGERIVVPLTLPSSTSLLSWLASQPIFPQFYWHGRDNQQEAAVCGAVMYFNDMATACQWLRRHRLESMRIWGLNQFDQLQPSAPKSALFLPRFELLRNAEGVQLAVNVFSETSLADDVAAAQAAVKQLAVSQPLAELNVSVMRAQHQPERQDWYALLHQALDAIQQRQLEKVVLARKTTLILNRPLNPAAFLNASEQVNHHCFHFMMRMNNHRAFLGSSPERLFWRQGQQLVTEALAGTVAGSDDEQQAARLGAWLMNDDKNQHENRLVVEDICQRVRDNAAAIDVLPVEIARLRKVQHLRREIRIALAVIDDADSLQRLQPTAAVAGLPRQEARRFILYHEPFDRGWYAGSAGFVSLNQTEFAVSLRSACVDGKQVHLYAGAGIVAGSDPQEEWQEIENKAAGLRTLLDGESVRAASFGLADDRLHVK